MSTRKENNVLPGLTAISSKGTMFWCRNRFKILISRKAVMGTPSFSLCMRIRFMAKTGCGVDPAGESFLRALCTSLLFE